MGGGGSHCAVVPLWSGRCKNILSDYLKRLYDKFGCVRSHATSEYKVKLCYALLCDAHLLALHLQ